MHAWGGYEKYAWAYDELCPLSQKGELRQRSGCGSCGELAAELARKAAAGTWPYCHTTCLGWLRPAERDLCCSFAFAGKNDFGGLGATIIDSLDTLHMMGEPWALCRCAAQC